MSTILIRRGLLWSLLLLQGVPASAATLWQIGKADNDTREFALAPSNYAGFSDRFGYHDQFYVVGRSADGENWPYCLAGPADGWGGGNNKINTLPIHFHLKRLRRRSQCRLVIDFAGIHPERPPLLRVSVNGHHHDFQLPPGAEGPIQGRLDEGKEHILSIDIPAGELRVGLNTIELVHLTGSWVVFDALRFEGSDDVRPGPAHETLIHSVRAAPFQVRREGRAYQPLLVDVTQLDSAAELTFRIKGAGRTTRTVEPGRSILEVDMPPVDEPTVASVGIRSGGTTLLRTEITRDKVPMVTPADYVDPFTGTADSRWMLTPGPWMPLSMVKISPINEDWKWKAGYEYRIENIMGFDHIHSWTMAGLLLMPTVGPLQTQPGPADDPDQGYRSRIDHDEEKAGIGFYEVMLKDYDVKVELTSTTRAALQRYTFPETDQARVLIDLEFPSEEPYHNEMVEGRITRASDREITGYSRFEGRRGSKYQDYTLYFVVQFSKPFASMGAWNDGQIVREVSQASGPGDLGAFLNFKTRAGEHILVRSGVSFVSIANARENLIRELIEPFDWDFQAVVDHQRKTWNDLFRRIEIETDDHLQKVKFYTNFYRAFCARTIMSDVNGQYVDMYERTQQLDDPDWPVLGCDAFWNTFWNLNQLWNLAAPDVSEKWVRSLLEINDKGGWLPKGPAGVEYTSIMVAEHAIPLIVAAYQHGIRGFDPEEALEAMVHTQTAPAQAHPGGGHVGNYQLKPYLQYGYIPIGQGAASNTLEYAYDDWCVAQFAKALNKSDIYEQFSKRGAYWRNIFDTDSGFARPRYADGRWLEDFNPYSGKGGWVEGNPWQFTWFVPQDVKGLAEAMGRERFIERLNEGLAKSEPSRFNATGDRMADYPINHGNQPSMQVAWLFNHAGAPWLTQKWTRAILERYYGVGPSDGYPGDEDQGQMSAWFLMSALGLFQTDGGCRIDPVYEIGSPRFEKATIRLHPDYYKGGAFTIVARNASRLNQYVQSATLNGKALDRWWISAKDLQAGGTLVVEMGRDPNKDWAARGGDAGASVTGRYDVTTPVPEAIRRRLDLAPFYQKCLDMDGLPVVGSAYVSDHALREAAWILRHMLAGRSDIINAMAESKVRVAVMAATEYTTDVPEHSRLKPKVYWDRRARGLGATPHAPAVSCGEENLLCHPGDPYSTENILIHEFAHAMHAMGLPAVDPAFDGKLKAAYEKAKGRGLWPDTYAITNRHEYWAEAVQCWFDNNRENDALHCHVNTRAELKEYDPELAKLCAEVFGDGSWRYRKPMDRPATGRAHLTGWDPDRAPHFRWRRAPLTDKPRVLIQTAIGDIEVELDAVRAPVTTKNFLRYVLEGFYSDGVFFRTVTASNQPEDPVKIAVVQAQANPSWEEKAFRPIAIERTRDTGLRHLDGTISMARSDPDTATHHFFICVGDQPELDFGGKRNPDGQGFAAFGRVVKGMEVVRRIHESQAEGQTLTPPVRIQRAVRVH